MKKLMPETPLLASQSVWGLTGKRIHAGSRVPLRLPAELDLALHLPAGTGLNLLLEEHVMGRDLRVEGRGKQWRIPPRPLSDTGDGMLLVLAELAARKWRGVLTDNRAIHTDVSREAYLRGEGNAPVQFVADFCGWPDTFCAYGYADEPPHAVGRAALVICWKVKPSLSGETAPCP